MRHGNLMCVGLIGASLALSACSNSDGPAQPEASAQADATPCEPDAGVTYLCGPVNAEDLLRLGDTRWLIASGMNGQLTGTDATGHLYLIDHQGKSWSEWFPGENPAFQHDTAMFKDCPGPIDTANFSAHGLSLQQGAGSKYRLYITSHGAREAIEVFDVDAGGARPTIAWAGCVVLPADVFANSVAILPDGGFVTTKFMDPTVPQDQAFADITQGKVNGLVYEWRPGDAVVPLQGTELSGPNGIAVSSFGQTIHVAAFGTREVVRFERSGRSLRKHVVKLDITPDNLRWTAGGRLLTAGGNYVAPEACATPPCNTGWSVVEIHPQTMSARRVTGADQSASLQGVSVAERVGDTIWVGTYSGDRVGYMPAQ
jgi:sugar lactone lactonase YvrE